MIGSVLLCSIYVLPTTIQDPTNAPQASPPLSSKYYPEGAVDEPSYAAWLAERDKSLQQLVSQAAPQALAKQRAHHANWILAVRCEPHASRLLLGTHRPQDLKALETFGKETLQLLTLATGHWPSDDVDNVERLELLAHFGRAMSLVAQAKMGRPEKGAAQEVFEKLAIWTDDDDVHIATAALLWQAKLAHEYGKTDRALKALPLALTPLSAGPADFYLRLLRCRLLADSARTSLSLALMLKMEERCAQWFSNEIDRHHAMCTLTWMRLQIARADEPQLSSFPQTLRKEWLTRAEDFLKDQESPCRLLRLEKAVPLLFAAPKPQEPAAGPAGPKPEPTTAPAPEQPSARESAQESG